jgi:hypothetical protein
MGVPGRAAACDSTSRSMSRCCSCASMLDLSAVADSLKPASGRGELALTCNRSMRGPAKIPPQRVSAGPAAHLSRRRWPSNWTFGQSCMTDRLLTAGPVVDRTRRHLLSRRSPQRCRTRSVYWCRCGVAGFLAPASLGLVGRADDGSDVALLGGDVGPGPHGLPDKHVPLFVVARRGRSSLRLSPHGAALYLPPGTRLHTLWWGSRLGYRLPQRSASPTLTTCASWSARATATWWRCPPRPPGRGPA